MHATYFAQLIFLHFITSVISGQRLVLRIPFYVITVRRLLSPLCPQYSPWNYSPKLTYL
jgi:hypothetical protein